jgi:chromate reductase, NAD(P)H dehydrogenase (quinone)
MKIIGISGSLRTISLSTALLKTAATLAPCDVKLMVYDGIGNLPHFNPELDKEPAPAVVSDFRSQLNSSAGVVISTPEYAHGIPGALKNALDWLVASGELYEKPVALFSASPYARFAPASLIETLTVMMARLIPDAFINISLHHGLENGGLQKTANMCLSRCVERAIAAFAEAIDPTYTQGMGSSKSNTLPCGGT